MPSIDHEGLIELFRNRPELVPELMREALHVDVPPYTEVRVERGDFSDIKLTNADLVVLLAHGRPVMAIVVEVQLDRDPDKKFSWPWYLAALRMRLRCPVRLLCVAIDLRIAAWCAAPIEMGHPGWVLKPLVLGPTTIPVIVDAERAKQDPELAVLSAMAHGQTEKEEVVAKAAYVAVTALDPGRAKIYLTLIERALSEAARRALEEIMKVGKFDITGSLVEKFILEGEAKGEARGRAEGKAEGEAKGELKAVLMVLKARGIDIPEALLQRILGCQDIEQLDRWVSRAAVISSADELFAEPARASS